MTILDDQTTAPSEEALARALLLRLLSQAFAYPTAPEVERLVGEDVPLALGARRHLPDAVCRALTAFAGAVKGTTAIELEARYCEVFTHVHSADCPLYETDYGPRDVWRQSNTLADIAGFYRAFGFDPAGERPDHVSVELEFLHVLAYKEAWATAHGEGAKADVCRDAALAFERDHALRWLPGLAARAEALGSAGPFAAVARLLAELCVVESERTGVSPPEDLPVPTGASDVDDDAPSLCEVEE
jgi:TorA maturation chaperone TorD